MENKTLINSKLLEEQIASELKNISKIKGEDNWNSVRNSELFVKKVVKTITGDRLSVWPQTLEHAKGLQYSRGAYKDNNKVSEDMMPQFKEGMKLTSLDQVRIHELDVVIDGWNRIINDQIKNGETAVLPLLAPKTMCEIGFRWPRLIREYTKNKEYSNGFGYDISKINSDFGKLMGYDTRFHDLNDKNMPIDLANADVVLMYHVLEHLYNPFQAIVKLKQSVKKYTLLHIEIPIERDNPQVQYGHLFGFHENDLNKYFTAAGFKIISEIKKRSVGGLHTERIVAISI